MSEARITEIHVEGLRTLADVRIKLDGLTVLIGENGTGKSSIIEACELLRRVASQDFLSEFYNPHGGAFSLLRDGAARLRLTVQIELHSKRSALLEYGLSLVRAGLGVAIEEEHLWLLTPGQDAPVQVFIERDRRGARYRASTGLTALPNFAPTKLALASGSEAVGGNPIIYLAHDALQSIDVQLAFEVLPAWVARATSRKSEIRGSVLLQPAQRLELLGANLVNVYYALREQSDRAYWDDTMDLLRLGLGAAFEEVRTAADPGGGAHALAIKWRGRDQPMTASALSDGQISFLAFVALYRLPRGRALLAIDEPEVHLHPGLLVRIAQMFEAMGQTSPVLIATHSDRLLDALSDPAAAVRVCELEGGATRIRRLDAAALTEWLDDYRGLGDLRSGGHLVDVLKADE